MKTLYFKILFTSFLLLGQINGYSQQTANYETDKKQLVSDELKNLPLIFRKNDGQWDQKILYKGTSPKGDIFFRKNGITFTHSRKSASSLNDLDLEHISWNLSFEGISEKALISAKGEQTSKTNYLLGSNPTTYRYNVPDHNQINYQEVYPNIDLRYYGSGKDLKYDYILKPGSDISSIRMKCDGIEQLRINDDGELELKHAWGVIKENKPYSYQIIDGIKKEIDVRFQLINRSTYGFQFYGEYDPTQTVIVDPVSLVWGTYVGGNTPTNGGYLYDLTTDQDGHIYATGYYPNTFPISSQAYDQTYNGGYGDVFVFKLDRSGTFLHYATYIGGNGDDRGKGIAVNDAGEAFITGYTESASTSFPNTKTFGGAMSGQNIFVCKLNASGSSLMYSTYIGGLNHDIANGIIIDKATGIATVVGETQSTNFPVTAGSYDPTYNGGSSDAFFLQLNPAGNALAYSTFIGGAGDDRGRALQIGQTGVFVTGLTASSNFPTTAGAYDVSHNGDFDVFVAKINGGNLVYSTFIGGAKGDEGTSIDVNAADEAFICGYSYSIDYPRTLGDPLKERDVILTRLSASGASIIYSRFIGGSANDEGTSIIVNSKDQAFIAGTTQSLDYPLVISNITDPDPTKDKENQVFVTMIDETGAVLKKSIKIGGSFDDYKVPSLSFPDKSAICNVVVGFTSHSPDLGTTEGSYQKNKLNGNEANDQPAVFQFYMGPDSLPKLNLPTVEAVCVGDVKTYKAKCSEDPDYPCTYYWAQGIYDDKWNFAEYKFLGDQEEVTFVIDNSFKTFYYVRLVRSNGCQTKIDSIKYTFPPPSSPPVFDPLCAGGSTTVKGGSASHTYEWSTGATGTEIIITSAGDYWVKATNTCGESATFNFKVELFNKPTVDLGQDRTYCSPFSLVLDADDASDNVPRTYLWSTGSTSSSIQVIKGGSYSVEVTNLCGTVSDQVLITELFKPIVNLGNDTSMCQNSSIVLNAGNPDLFKVWSTGSNSTTITVSTPGIYWVDVFDVCGVTRDSIVIENALEVPVVNLGPDQTICSAFTLTLDATHGVSNYYWSTGETTPTIIISAGGTYSVVVTNGCGVTTDEITITAPPSLNLELGPDQIICNPQTVTFSANDPGGNVTYNWSNGANTPSITIGVSGNYSVTVTNACGSASDHVLLTVQTISPLVNLGQDSAICPNVDFILDAQNLSSSFLWSTGETTQTIAVNIAVKDTFWVDVINSCGSTRDSIILDIALPPSYNLGPDTSICLPATLMLDAGNPGATYVWKNGATSSTITVNSSGIYYVDITRCATIRDSIVVTLNSNDPIVNLGRDTTICDAFIKILDAGNNPGSKFSWYPDGQTSQSISVNVGKLYIVEAANGCGSTKDSINIIGDPYPNLGDDVAICLADTILLDAGNQASGATYSWTPTGATTPTLKVFKSGTYKVDVTNVCGNLTDEILISIDTLPCVVELGPDQRICAPASVMLDAENDGSTYLWSTGETTRTISVNAAGEYKVEVTNGCGVTPDSVFILVDNAPPIVNLGPDQTVCTPVNIRLNAGNTNSISYQWFPGNQTTRTLGVTAGGTYSVKVTNACGSDSNGVVIHEIFHPVVHLGADQKVCIPDPVTNLIILNAGHSGANYLWTPGGETTQSIGVEKTGTYSVSTSNICGVYSDEIYVLIDTLPPVISLGPDTNICSPFGYVIQAGNHTGASIVWTPGGETTNSITVKNGGSYSVSITNQCGTSTDNIFVAPNPVLVDARPDTIICISDTIQLSTIFDASYTYLWEPSTGLNQDDIYNPLAVPLVSTRYSVLASDGICSNSDTAVVNVFPVLKPEIVASPMDGYIPLTVNFQNANSAPAHLWTLGDGETSTASSFTHTYKSESVFTVVLMTTSPQGCIEYDSVQIVAFSLFIPNLLTPNGDGFNEKFDLTNLNVNLDLEIYNRWGDLVYKKDNYVNEWPEKDTADGIYYYYIHDAKYKKAFKGWVQILTKAEKSQE